MVVISVPMKKEREAQPPWVEVAGFEPVRPEGHQLGKLARLPFRHTVQRYNFIVR